MSYREQLENLIADNNGIVVTNEVEKQGIPRHYLTPLVREGKLDRVSHGVYVTPDAFEDEMYMLQMKSPKVIFSHETALFFHDLTDRDPLEWSVTVPNGYNATKLRDSGIQVYSVKKSLHLMGTTEVETLFGRKVTAYNKERTICDIIRNRNNMDIAILNDALKRYLASKDKNISLLMKYAKELRVQKILRSYMEILL
ncbi:type IV toxin-antitoxin system AbiEi family antitoxin domain-containing protein [Schinkia azotoformans]|uniref:type IV toxin-antitoxin system AbiEi family antitoxin domain-containing protein n=1 Tax=Schinkia azotoformans TaxID=1454 RepID=UPI002DC00585|nr:type IV toxin-antitoxin system AbiEi family antitoxin domain-containing protein [Schinkia azotoformans]MEC1771950.1 type IV toxin-antitoxin system AbiEi family antitoxin domain-containing protein [Schinkia azotoformans]MED4366448.1 type IV toxin-antitoxin system AbiEi family antitoxin domain-containing protein [Schinkia azotoformans]